MKKLLRPLLCFFWLTLNVVSSDVSEALSQVERIKQAQHLLAEVELRSTEEIVIDLNQATYPEGQLQILEAVAKTYRDMIHHYDVKTLAKKEWLHSMILLNMAYFQFGGADEDQYATMLNVAIRRKLKSYMSKELTGHPGLFHSLQE